VPDILLTHNRVFPILPVRKGKFLSIVVPEPSPVTTRLNEEENKKDILFNIDETHSKEKT
jgi:hypothetical protein